MQDDIEEKVDVKFHRLHGEVLYIECESLERVMDYIIKNADSIELEGMKEMQETILQALDMGKVRSLLTP